MKNQLIEMEIKDSDCPEVESIRNENINDNVNLNIDEISKKKQKKNKKNYKSIIIFISIFFFSVIIIVAALILKFNNNDLIDNNIEKNKGIVELISKDNYNDKIRIKKELLKSVNSFIVCLGSPGAGKSTFASNYYKELYKVKNDYFESSDEALTFTKGIWMITDEERRKIPQYINKDLLDVEGFQIDDNKSWKYVMIIAFLSTDLIILNRNPRFDDVKKIIKIIENGLKKMQKMNIPRILKVIYIQTINKPKKIIPIEKLLETFEIDKNIFQTIKFQYIYLPNITPGEEKDLMKYRDYRKNFKKILNLLNIINNYNSVASLINYIDIFNEAINGNSIFDSQTILKDIEIDFNGVYSRYENKFKNELTHKFSNLTKLIKLNETFEDFIDNHINFSFEFEIKYEDFTYYGSSKTYNDYYENLKKNKPFRIDPKDIFLDLYNLEKSRLESQENNNKQEIFNEYQKKQLEINEYFDSLKFYEEIKNMDLELKIDKENDQFDYKIKKESELKDYFFRKKKEKEKDWEGQIQRAKWKVTVQAHGELKCKNGHSLTEDIYCGRCHQNLFWVDSNERYVICKGCNKVRKMTEKLICGRCGADSLSTVKWIKDYKP